MGFIIYHHNHIWTIDSMNAMNVYMLKSFVDGCSGFKLIIGGTNHLTGIVMLLLPQLVVQNLISFFL
jgi:hypothetical protein